MCKYADVQMGVCNFKIVVKLGHNDRIHEFIIQAPFEKFFFFESDLL